MNFTRIALAGLGAFVVYMVLGGLMFTAIPSLTIEFQKYPAVYRDLNGQKSHMPLGMAGMLLSMIALAVLYAMLYKGGSGIEVGASFGALIGVYSIGSFVLHNYVNLNIGMRLTVFSATAYLIQWTAVGIIVGMIYKPVQ